MFRDIKRDAFHRSHPLVPAMNASTTPVSCLTLPRTRAHARSRPYTHVHVRTYVRPGGGRHNQPRELSGTALAYSTRANSPPPFSLTLSLSLLLPLPLSPSPTPFDGYTPNLQLSPSHHHEHAIYYTPLPLPEGTAGCAAGSL